MQITQYTADRGLPLASEPLIPYSLVFHIDRDTLYRANCDRLANHERLAKFAHLHPDESVEHDRVVLLLALLHILLVLLVGLVVQPVEVRVAVTVGALTLATDARRIIHRSVDVAHFTPCKVRPHNTHWLFGCSSSKILVSASGKGAFYAKLPPTNIRVT